MDAKNKLGQEVIKHLRDCGEVQEVLVPCNIRPVELKVILHLKHG